MQTLSREVLCLPSKGISYVVRCTRPHRVHQDAQSKIIEETFYFLNKEHFCMSQVSLVSPFVPLGRGRNSTLLPKRKLICRYFLKMIIKDIWKRASYIAVYFTQPPPYPRCHLVDDYQWSWSWTKLTMIACSTWDYQRTWSLTIKVHVIRWFQSR